ncbi:BrnT family toxin [Luteimonas granuli]|uniref:BrnT family toxin n=1 Tax=Luteimonas granuli TaxID=1176533 RepID=A0A518N3B0_9GAMM|nr:BrnT family toxin [Luteimonas granuli]QDW66357.1 BrnT family toxin [Luteimonas granuli]
MEFEFDPGKARGNLTKHGIAFADVEPVFMDPQAITNRSDRKTAQGEFEERYISTGMDALGRIVTVAWTPRNGNVRLISARRAREEEKAGYEQR